MSDASRDAEVRRLAHEIVLEWVHERDQIEGWPPVDVAAWALACARELVAETPAADSAPVSGNFAAIYHGVAHDPTRTDCNCIACALERGRDDS